VFTRCSCATRRQVTHCTRRLVSAAGVGTWRTSCDNDTRNVTAPTATVAISSERDLTVTVTVTVTGRLQISERSVTQRSAQSSLQYRRHCRQAQDLLVPENVWGRPQPPIQ
jgi:hypothetical protein